MFSRAPIKRFNETTDDNPPPGAYDPKFNTNIADYSKGPDFDRQLINTAHAFSTNSNNAFSPRPPSRSSSRPGSRPGSQRCSRHASPSTSAANSSVERTDSANKSLKVQVHSQQKLITLAHKTPGDFGSHANDHPSRPKYLRADPHHRIIQQATKATETNMDDIPLSTFDLTPEAVGLQSRIETLEQRLSREIERFNQLKEQSMEYKKLIHDMQLETALVAETPRPETSSASTCTDPDMREKEISELRDSHMRISEKMSKLGEENEKLLIERDSYKIQLDSKLSTFESTKDELKILQNKLHATEQNWKAAEEKCKVIREEMDECTRIIQENASIVRECPLCKELSKLKAELEEERKRTEELNSQCAYLNKRYVASKDERRQKENEWNLLLKQREKEIVRLTTAIATSVQNVGETSTIANKRDPRKTESKARIHQDIKNGNFHESDSSAFVPPCSTESQSDDDDDVFQLSPTLFISSTKSASTKSRTNLLTPFQEDGPSIKESYLLKEREAIKKGMSHLTSGKQTVQSRITKLETNNNAALKECERLISENQRLKEILSTSDISDMGIQFIKRKKIIPDNSAELDVDPFEFRRTDMSHKSLSSPSSGKEEIRPRSLFPETSPSDETGDNKAHHS